MQSYSNGLNLAFSDIVHTLSPSPMPEPPLEQHPSHTEPTNILAGPSSQQMQPSSHWSGSDEPQPLSDAELHAIQTRILQFGNPTVSSTLSSRENELLQMMLRLTSHASILPDPAQLTVQAETIAGLTQQRNFLLAERTEEQKRWEAERESFDRITEALISKRKAAAGTRVVDDDTQRHIARLEDDNKALKYKLNETQQRMSTLESDLNRLRPLLVMQTIVSRPDASTSSIKPLPTRRKRKPQQSTPQPDNTSTSMSFSQATEVLTDTDINFSQASSSSRPKSHYRFTEADTSQTSVRKGKKTKTPPLPSSGTTASEGLRFKPILADARSEMLLSAAKRIGRTRTGMLAGVVRSSSPPEKKAEKEKEKEGEGRKRKPQAKGKQKAGSTPGPSASTSTTRRTQSVTNLANAPPRTPRRTATVPNLNATPNASQHPSHLHPSTNRPRNEIVYINPGAVPAVTVPMPVIVPFTQGTTAWPASLPTHATPTTNRIQQHSSQSLRTPTSNTRTPKNRNGTGDDETGSQGQGTPFNSLLTAARSMMVDGVFDDHDEDVRTEGGATPRANPMDPYTPTRPRHQVDTSESPLAKRRKLDTTTTPSQVSQSVASTPDKAGRLGKGPPARVRSALDVLADQAAQEQERRPSVDGGSQRPSAEPDSADPTPSKTRKGKAVDRVSNDERNSRRPPSAPPPSTSISVETTFVDLRNPSSRRSSSRNGTETEEEVPTRPSTPPNGFARTVSEEPSPSRRVRAVPVNVNGERRDLGTPRKITVIPIQK